ncbi:MAG: BBP7 family outer membrane beta-barrel protein [Planctomycetes bacterium]|nr:BBP7 family outer membrane beta-barrel protein [Planctomycetota bacterium]
MKSIHLATGLLVGMTAASASAQYAGYPSQAAAPRAAYNAGYAPAPAVPTTQPLTPTWAAPQTAAGPAPNGWGVAPPMTAQAGYPPAANANYGVPNAPTRPVAQVSYPNYQPTATPGNSQLRAPLSPTAGYAPFAARQQAAGQVPARFVSQPTPPAPGLGYPGQSYAPTPAAGMPPSESVPAPAAGNPAWGTPPMNAAPGAYGAMPDPNYGAPNYGAPSGAPVMQNYPGPTAGGYPGFQGPAAQPSGPTGGWGAPSGMPTGNVFNDPSNYAAPGGYGGAGGYGAGGYCGPDGSCEPCFNGNGPRWFGGMAYLLMTRDLPNARTITFDNTNLASNVIDMRDTVNGQWRSGGEARVGHVLNCNWAVEGVFWMLDPFYYTAGATSSTNSLSSALDFATGGPVTINGTSADTFFDNAHTQYVQRRDEIYNLEINFLRQSMCDPCSRWGVMGIAGFRWFHFHEGWTYGSSQAGTDPFANGGTTSAQYTVQTTNDLLGGQVGARMHWYVLPNLRLYATPKVAVLANSINTRNFLHSDAGALGFDNQGYKNDVTMLGQIDLGAAWQMTPRWSTFISYRAMGVAGLALAENQIPQYMADTAYMQSVHTNGSLILHGLVTGIQFAY